MTRGQALLTIAVVSTAILALSAWMFGDPSRGPGWLFFIVGLLGWLVFLMAVLIEIVQTVRSEQAGPKNDFTITE